MKHTDLMLNDLVMYQGKILRVGCISDYDIKIDLFEDGEDTPYAEIWQEELDEVKPIPLTSEILEKNGFVPDNFSPYYLPIKDGSVRFSKHQYGLYCNILRPYQRYDGVCNYVHNLQHALRECGIDKEIVL